MVEMGYVLNDGWKNVQCLSYIHICLFFVMLLYTDAV